MTIRLVKSIAEDLGYSVFPVVDDQFMAADDMMAIVGFFTFHEQEQFYWQFTGFPDLSIDKQLFKKSWDGNSLIALGHPHHAAKQLIGIKEMGDYLDFTISNDFYYSGILIISH